MKRWDIAVSNGHPLVDLLSVIEYTIIDGNIVHSI